MSVAVHIKWNELVSVKIILGLMVVPTSIRCDIPLVVLLKIYFLYSGVNFSLGKGNHIKRCIVFYFDIIIITIIISFGAHEKSPTHF